MIHLALDINIGVQLMRWWYWCGRARGQGGLRAEVRRVPGHRDAGAHAPARTGLCAADSVDVRGVRGKGGADRPQKPVRGVCRAQGCARTQSARGAHRQRSA